MRIDEKDQRIFLLHLGLSFLIPFFLFSYIIML
jgi:hypothetical protein